MSPSAALPSAPFTHTPNGGGAAEAPNVKMPRPVCHHRDGASKTARSNIPMKEDQIYGSQGTRPRHEDHDDHPARWEDHHDHPQGRREVTAATRLAAAVHSALDIPVPTTTRDAAAFGNVLTRRTELIRDAVEGVTTDEDARIATRLIAAAEQAYPITYPSRADVDGGGPR